MFYPKKLLSLKVVVRRSWPKRVKSMQPDSECNKRIRAKAGGATPKDSTPTKKTGNFKKASTFNGDTPTSSTNKKKTDISQFFKKMERQTPSSTNPKEDGIPESPATLLLNRIQAECYTPLSELIKDTNNKKSNMQPQHNEDNPTDKRVGISKKALNFQERDEVETTDQENTETTRTTRNSMLQQHKSDMSTTLEVCNTPSPTKRSRPRRRSVLPAGELETVSKSLDNLVLFTTPNKSTATRRRSSIHIPKDMSMSLDTPIKLNNIAPIMEESNEAEQIGDKVPKSVTKRRTLYTAKAIGQTKSPTKAIDTPNTKRTTRRRTLYDSKTMEISEINDKANKDRTSVSSRRRTCFHAKSLEETDITETTGSEDDITLSKKQDEKVNKILESNANDINIAKSKKTPNRRATLYRQPNPQVAVSFNVSCGDSSSNSSIYGTPSNFPTSKVVSSTLLEDSDVSNGCRQVMATPPADATTGKLLEETEQCVSPLIFSSTRLPGNKRRTLFDVSMDIITQRLQCINQSARKSLAPPTPAEEIGEKLLSTPIANTDTKSQTSKESLHECLDSNDGQSSKRKRKLFMPNEIMATPPPVQQPTPKATESRVQTGSSSVNRRRTLMPISQPLPTNNVTLRDTTSSTNSISVRNRRSTLDFEQLANNTKTLQTSNESLNECLDNNDEQCLKRKRKLFMPNEVMATPPPAQQPLPIAAETNVISKVSQTSITTTGSSSVTRRRTLMPISQPLPTNNVTLRDATTSTNSISVRKRRSTLDFEQIQCITTNNSSTSSTLKSCSQQSVGKPLKKAPVLVYTNMHQQQIDVIREVGKTPTTTPTPTKR